MTTGKESNRYKTIIELLKKYVGIIDMDVKYAASSLPSCLDENELRDINAECSLYKRTLRLRRIISKHLDGKFDNYEINFWIIQEWGGIYNFRDNGLNRNKIKFFSESIKSGLTRGLGNIASLSKVAAFVSPDEYFIYDSRAVFSLDKILLEADYDGPFFPIPEGRNKNIDIKSLRDSIKRAQKCFYKRNDAYCHYNELLKCLAKSVYGNNENLDRLEMLLFVLAESDNYNVLNRLQ